MSLLLVESFDLFNSTLANTGLQSKWQIIGLNGGGGTEALVTGRFFGGQAFRAGGAIGTSGTGIRQLFSGGGVSSLSCGFAFKADNLSVAPDIFWLLNGTTYQVGLQLLTTGQLAAGRYTSVNGRTNLGTTATAVVSLSTWHYIEVEIVIDNTVGVFNLYVDGVQVLNLTGQDTLNSGTTVSQIQVGMSTGGAASGFFYYYDDMYIIDAATRLGESCVETLRPANDTAQKDFTPNSGSNNFDRVNEAHCDGDTTYVQSSTVGARDLYGLGALSSTPGTIRGIQITSFGVKTDASTRTIYNSVQSNGTDSDGASFALAASYSCFSRIMDLDPSGSVAWTPTRVNNLLIGPKVAS